MGKKLTTEDFVEKAIAVHGSTYSYESANYVGGKKKIEIICLNGHGSFWQVASSHITQKAGCPACGKNEVPSTESYIAKCKEFHGDRFSYERTVYSNCSSKVIVTCKVHGDFLTLASKHVRGAGCSICSGVAKPSTSEFIEQSKAVHGEKYTYTKVSYVKAHAKVVITCRIHGDFEITPDKHKGGRGCQSCTGRCTDTASFIEFCTSKHNNKYSYEKAEYVSAKSMVIITCSAHGDFQMTPSDHKTGNGCTACATNGYNAKKSGYLYVLSDSTITKVGITNRSVEDRRKKIVKSSSLAFTEKFSFFFENGSIARALEKETLTHLKSFHKQPTEVFDGSTESFYGVDLEKLQTLISQKISILKDTQSILTDKPEVLNIENN